MIFIDIEKHSEDDDAVLYDFCTNTPSPGRLRIDRSTGQVIHLDLCGCAGDPQYHGRRAGRVIWMHWKAGEYPQTTRFEKE